MNNTLIEFDGKQLPLTHYFSDGIYAREIFMPKGSIVVGHIHKTTHLNIVITGKALVWMNGEVVKITAPYTFESKAGVRKVLYIEEDMIWNTIHPTVETDLDKLTDTFIDKEASEDIDVYKALNKFEEILCLGQ